jgi:hypothetical protein
LNCPRENRVCLSCKAGKVEDEQDFFEKIKSILGEVNKKVFNKRQMIALLNSNSPKLLNIIVNFRNVCPDVLAIHFKSILLVFKQ